MDNIIVVAVKSIIVHNRKVLIAKRTTEDKYGAGIWEVIGGKLEFGEDLVDGLKREIMEETGLEVEVKELLYASTFQTDEHRQVVILNYLSNTDSEQVKLSSEHTEYLCAGQNTMQRLLGKRFLTNLEKNHIFEKLYIIED
jgi:8-oxo-dGTP diphosphatase